MIQKVEKNFHTSLKSSSIVRKKLQQYAPQSGGRGVLPGNTESETTS
jgi:hypothetical protein